MRTLESILVSIKNKVGLDEDYMAFDDQIIDSINSVFFYLWQLGVGRDTSKPFKIKDKKAVWTDFIDDGMVETVRDYIGKRVKLAFDPPQNSFLIENIKSQILEDEWRMTVGMDEYNCKAKASEVST